MRYWLKISLKNRVKPIFDYSEMEREGRVVREGGKEKEINGNGAKMIF